MKVKFFVAFLSIMMLFSMPAYAMELPEISCDTQTAQDGEAAELEVAISNNPGIASWLFELTWDQTVVQLDSITRGGEFSKGTFIKNDSTPGKLTVTWFNTTNVTEDASLFTVRFTTSGTAGKDTAVEISYSAADTVNEKGERVPLQIKDPIELIGGNLPAASGSGIGNPEGNGPGADGIENSYPPNSESDGKNQAAGEENGGKDELAQENGSSLETATPSEATNPGGSGLLPVTAKMFIDVGEKDYFFDPVSWAVRNGITFGTSANEFSPNGICTRAQAVTFLWRSVGSPEPSLFTDQFADVHSDAYYYEAVMWAIENDITLGTGHSTFSPDDTVTRGQLVTFLWRTAGREDAGNGGNFLDVSEDAYYFIPVRWAVERAITLGTGNGIFSPDSPCTRGQTVTFLYRFAQDQ